MAVKPAQNPCKIRREVVFFQHSAQTPYHGNTARQADAELQQKSVHLVGGFDALPYQRVPDPMQGSHCLRVLRAGFYKTHRGPGSGLADSFRIDKIVLVTLNKRADELRRNQLRLMAQISNLASHKLLTAAGLHHHGRRLTGTEKMNQLSAGKLFTQQGVAMFVLTVDMEGMFTEIDANKRNVLHDGFLKIKHPASVPLTGCG
ncbi:Uncharacterised protein [Yersinia enterocolitica]|nr:Uncharacterised protein [Yersinia enterocolitica]